MNNIKLHNFKRYDIFHKIFFARAQTNFTNPPKSVCWNCQKTINIGKNCRFCNVLQPMTIKDNYFSYLGLQEQFQLDEKELKKRFRNIQAIVHPDKFSQHSNHEQQLSDQHSSFLNNAYRTLKDPFSRADYLLKIMDKEDTESTKDNEFAMEIMEMNEEISAQTDLKFFQERLAYVNNEIQKRFDKLKEIFSNRNLKEAKRIIDELHYLKRTQKIVNNKIGNNVD